MSTAAQFRAAALAHAPLVALVGQRVALSAIEPGLPSPYVVYAVRHDPAYTLDNTIVDPGVSVDAQCWATTAVEALAVAQALREAVESVGAVVVSQTSGYDDELDLDAEILSIEWPATVSTWPGHRAI